MTNESYIVSETKYFEGSIIEPLWCSQGFYPCREGSIQLIEPYLDTPTLGFYIEPLGFYIEPLCTLNF